MGIADRTTLTALSENLDFGDVADPTLRLAYFQYMTDLSDANYNYVAELVAGGTLQPYPSFLSRQAIINGNFDVWQRGTSYTNPPNGTYIADRFKTVSGGSITTPPTITYSKQTLASGDIYNSFNYSRANFSGAGSGFGTTYDYNLSQWIENGIRYLCGAGKKITLSFWARSDIATKKIGVRAYQVYGTGGSPSATEIINGTKFTLTSTWTKQSFTFTTNTLVGKTFGTNGDDSLGIDLGFAWGSSGATQYGDTVAETFGGTGNIDIAQVQLCAGDAVLPFQPRSFAEELSLCQRYYERFEGATVGRASLGVAVAISTSNYLVAIPFKAAKRVSPIFTQGGGGFRILPSGVATTLTTSETNKESAALNCSATGATVSQAAFVQSVDAGGWIAFDAEL